jgi:hypothetical protein
MEGHATTLEAGSTPDTTYPARRSDMRDTIEHFMWGYQRHFSHAVERVASRVLESLKPGLNTKAFLVGVLVKEKEDRHPACVEPELHHWAESSAFYDVLSDVTEIQAAYPESQLSHSHPVAQSREDQNLFRRALRDAVVRRLESLPYLPPDIRIFSSIPVERDGYLVMTILTVTNRVFEEIPRVESEVLHIHRHRSFRVPCNLVEAAIMQILAKSNEAIIQPDAGSDLWLLVSTDQIKREAAALFFGGLLKRVNQDNMLMGVTEELFDTVSRLSLAAYERADAEGRLVFAERTAALGTPVLTLASPLPLSQSRALRKLLVLTNEAVALHCNYSSAFALVLAPGPVPAAVSVRVVGRGKWIVSGGNLDLMVMSDGLPSLPQPIVNEPALARDLRRLIPSLGEESAERFAAVATELAGSGHGSIVVITDAAFVEAERLGKDSLPVSPARLTPELADRLSQIDGALLCDPSGVCHAIGVILDGTSSSLGDRGRGSRFNSALRYVASSGTPAVAMVVSDDGGLDLLPKIMPPLSRREVSERLEEMKRLALCPSDPPDRERELDIENWLEGHAFYLDEAQCANANRWIETCRERAFRDSSVRVSRTPLASNPEFNPARDLI